MLASTYYEQSVEGAIGRLYEPRGSEIARFDNLIDMGLVMLRKWQPMVISDDYYLEALVTEKGILSLQEQGPVRIIQALLAALH